MTMAGCAARREHRGSAPSRPADWQCRRAWPCNSAPDGYVQGSAKDESTVSVTLLRGGAPEALPSRNAEQDGHLTIRTTRTVASFKESFSLRGVEGIQPPGDYNVYFEDELIQGLSRAAYRRVATMLQTPSASSPQDQSRLVSISATDLDAALMKDLHLTV